MRTRHFRYTAFIGITALLLFLGLLSAVPARAQDIARMDQVVRYYTDQKLFMGNILVVKDGKVLFERSGGSANLEWSIPNTPQTKFRLGSLTKQFTAVAILLLEERGKLKLDDPVSAYLPDTPPAWQNIRLFNLLTHTAGIPNYSGISGLRRRTVTPTELIATFKDKPLKFAPGEDWDYSNSNYAVLGAIIEKVSGEAYGQFLQENIFTPLGMKDTGYDDSATILPMRASGYVRRKGALFNAEFIDMSTPYAAGSLYSTTHDLLAWENALYGGKLLQPSSLKKMITPFRENYGFGLSIDDDKGHLRFSHNGGINGFSTALAWYPKDRIAIVVLDNVENGDANLIMTQLADITLERPVILASERKEIAVGADTLDRYVGRYAIHRGPTLTVTREGDHLYIQFDDQSKTEMFAEGSGNFFTKAFDAQFSFSAERDMPVGTLTIHQHGMEHSASRAL